MKEQLLKLSIDELRKLLKEIINKSVLEIPIQPNSNNQTPKAGNMQ